MNVLKKLSTLLDRKGYNKTFRNHLETVLEKTLFSGEKVLQLVEGKENNNFVFLLATDFGILYILTDIWPEPQVKRISYLEVESSKAIIGTDLRIHLEIDSQYEKYKIATYNLKSTLCFLKKVKQISSDRKDLQHMIGQAIS